MKPTELGRGRPQDWPREMRQVVRKVKARLKDAQSRGGPVALPHGLARDVVTAIHVGSDALEREQSPAPQPEDGE